MWNMSGKNFIGKGLFLCLVLSSFLGCQSQDFHSQDSNRTIRVASPTADPAPPEPESEPQFEPKPETNPPLADGNEKQPIFDNCEARVDRSITADLYRLPEGTKSLPDFNQMTPLKKVCLKQLDITNRDFTEGFPGVEGLVEWFALQIEFQIQVAQGGSYQFDLASDDGSKLYVNGDMIIDNDGQHSIEEVSGSVNLAPGLHSLRIEYFQGPRYRIALELFWTPPFQAERSYIPFALMSRKP